MASQVKRLRRNIFLHYPARLLPRDWADEFSADALVTVIVEEENADTTTDFEVEEVTYEYRDGETIPVRPRFPDP